MRKTALPLALLALVLFDGSARADDAVPYPEGYRDWRHVKSMVIGEAHPLSGAFAGIHHLYANAEAVRGYQGGRFPDGAVIVFDLLEAQATEDDALVEGGRKVVGVMHKDSRRWAATGGWGFEAFEGDSRERLLDAAGQVACFDCHAAKPQSDFVFSGLRP